MLFLNFTSAYCNIFNSIVSGTLKAVDKISDIAGEAKDFFKDQLPGCAEVVGLGTAYGSAKAALETASFAVKSAEIVGKKTALDSAQGVLEGAKQTSLGTLKLAELVGKGLGEGFNITCVRFLGSLDKLEFELNGIILEKTISIREAVDFDDIESFAKKIFNKLEDEVNKIF